MKITALEQLMNAERRYYVMLQQYAKAVNSAAPEGIERYKTELCDAFVELKQAQDNLAIDCDV